MDDALLPLVRLGIQARPKIPALRRALVLWSSQDRFGDEFYWWLEAKRRSAAEVELQLWAGGYSDDGGRFSREMAESAIVRSWSAARNTLGMWSEGRLYLSPEILSFAVRDLLDEIAPKLEYGPED